MRNTIGNGRDIGTLRSEKEASNQLDSGFGMDEFPGMDDPFGGSVEGQNTDFNSLFSDSGNGNSTGNNQGMMDPFSGLGSGGDLNGGLGSQQPSGQVNDMESLIANAAYEGGKALVKGVAHGVGVFSEELKESLEDNKIEDTYNFGVIDLKLGIAMCILGMIGLLIAIPIKGITTDSFFAVLIAGLLNSLIGFIISNAYVGKVREYRKQKEEVSDTVIENNDIGEEENFSTDLDDDDFPEFSNWNEDPDFSGDPIEEVNSASETVQESNIDVDALIDDMNDKGVPTGMYTRRYLFETFSKVLPIITPNFSFMDTIDEDSDDFLIYEDILREAAMLVGVNEDKIPRLLELHENLFIVQLKVERTCNGKEQAIADEIVAIYKKDKYGAVIEERRGTYAVVSTVGSFFMINLFVSTNPSISLGDIYAQNKDWVMDVNVKMPYVWGTDEFGKVLKCDIGATNSFIISGMPRAGKSWKAQSLLLQICMFSSPEEVQFYVCDTKDTTSDYYQMSHLLPHFKKFNGEKREILNCLRELTGPEAERRKNFLSSYDQISIADLKRKYPDVKMSYIYVVIDEMMSLNKSFTKDESVEFQEYLSYLVSKLPNLGYRVILIPHRIINEIISKQVYPLVNSKACVRATFDDIKNSLEVTRKDFQYDLPNKGDMALKSVDINGNRVVFCHGEVITKSNDTNNDVFRYVGEVWKRLCPGCDADMVGAGGSYKEGVRTAPDNSYDDTDFSFEDFEKKEVRNEVTIDDIDDAKDSDSSDFWD